MNNDEADKETAVVSLITSGSANALEAVYRAYAGYLTGVCTRYISDSSDIKDILHDSFIKIFNALSAFEYHGSGSFKAWISRVVVNECLKRLSKEKVTVSVEDLEESLSEPIVEPPIERISPEVLHAMIRDLPSGYRTVLNLYVFEGMSHREIAQLMNIKESTSASQYHRAKAMLARKIREYKSNQGL